MDMPKIGLIGCGKWGKNHARTLSRLGALAVVCDARAELLEQIRPMAPQVKTTTHVDSLLNDPEISGVVIATPPSTHFSLASRVLQSGRAVLVEKPMAMRVSEGEALVTLAEQKGLTLMVGHVLEYHPAIRKLHSLVSSGALGKIYYIQSNRLNFGRIRTEENSLWSFAPHDLAFLLRLVGRLPETVTCHGGAYLQSRVADMSLTHLRFSQDLQAHIYVSWLHPFKEHRLVVVGSQQMAVFNDGLDWKDKLSLYPHQVDWKEGNVPISTKAESKAVVLEEEEPLMAECRAFIESIQTGTPPLTDGKSGVAVLRLLETAQRSLERGGQPTPVALPTSESFAHPSAEIHKTASLGRGTKVWHFSHVMQDARIGKNCIIGQNVHVGRNVVVGDGCKIQNNVSLYDGVELEDNVFCGPSMVFTNVNTPRAHVERKNEFKKTILRKGATIGANATLICGNEIGHYAFIGAGAVVTHPVPAHALVIGNPAKVVGWVCECGEKLHFEEGEGGGIAHCSRCCLEFETNETGLTKLEQTSPTPRPVNETTHTSLY